MYQYIKTGNYTSSYTMLAFHQWGFSSGWGDMIPVPVEQRRWDQTFSSLSGETSSWYCQKASAKVKGIQIAGRIAVCFDVCWDVFPAVSKSLTFPALVSNYMQPLKSSVAAKLATSVKCTQRGWWREGAVNKQGVPWWLRGKSRSLTFKDECKLS